MLGAVSCWPSLSLAVARWRHRGQDGVPAASAAAPLVQLAVPAVLVVPAVAAVPTVAAAGREDVPVRPAGQTAAAAEARQWKTASVPEPRVPSSERGMPGESVTAAGTGRALAEKPSD